MHLGGLGGLNYALWGDSHALGRSKTMIFVFLFVKLHKTWKIIFPKTEKPDKGPPSPTCFSSQFSIFARKQNYGFRSPRGVGTAPEGIIKPPEAPQVHGSDSGDFRFFPFLGPLFCNFGVIFAKFCQKSGFPAVSSDSGSRFELPASKLVEISAWVGLRRISIFPFFRALIY